MDGNRARVLVVEDNKDALDVLSLVLGEKYSVFASTSPLETLQSLEAMKPDVLVLDIGLQPIDGLQFLEAVRAIPGYRDVPAVAMTGFAGDAERERFLDGGFQAVLVKPVPDLDELTGAIDRLVNRPAGDAHRAATHARPSRTVGKRSNAPASLDGTQRLTASGVGGSGATNGRRPA
jgi:CheY-like chemotaxis protein